MDSASHDYQINTSELAKMIEDDFSLLEYQLNERIYALRERFLATTDQASFERLNKCLQSEAVLRRCKQEYSHWLKNEFC